MAVEPISIEVPAGKAYVGRRCPCGHEFQYEDVDAHWDVEREDCNPEPGTEDLEEYDGMIGGSWECICPECHREVEYWWGWRHSEDRT